MKLTDKIGVSFAVYGLIYGAILGITVTVAFYVAEDAILDNFLVHSVEQVKESIAQNVDAPLARGLTLYSESVPADLASLAEGRYEVEQYRHVAVFRDPETQELLYLVLDETTAGLNVILSRILFGTLVVLVVAVIIGVVFARSLSRQLMRPMNKLVRRIDKLDLTNPNLEPLPTEDEIGFLSERFSTAIELLNEHDRRERDFTRFASHELRTPVTVLGGTTSILRSEEALSETGSRALSRSEAAIERMSRLIETFLFLGRSTDDSIRSTFTSSDVAREVNRLVELQAETGHKVELDLICDEGEFITNRLLLSVVLENLIANAARHGTGSLRARISPPEIVLTNPVDEVGVPGHGFGMEIAERICESLGFELHVTVDAKTFSARIFATSDEHTRADLNDGRTKT